MFFLPNCRPPMIDNIFQRKSFTDDCICERLLGIVDSFQDDRKKKTFSFCKIIVVFEVFRKHFFVSYWKEIEDVDALHLNKIKVILF